MFLVIVMISHCPNDTNTSDELLALKLKLVLNLFSSVC